MNNALLGYRRQVLILTFCLLGGVLLYKGDLDFAIALYRAPHDEAMKLHDQIEYAHAKVLRRPQFENMVKMDEERLSEESFQKGTNAEQNALVQERVLSLLGDQGLVPDTIEHEDGTSNNHFRRVEIRISFSSPLSKLMPLLKDINYAVPKIHVGELMLEPVETETEQRETVLHVQARLSAATKHD